MLEKVNCLCIIISLLIYVLHKCILIGTVEGVLGCFSQCYLNDLLAPLFFLPVCSFVLRWAGCKSLNFFVIILLGISAGIVWEYIAPLINPNATTDPFDLMCYFIGTVGYYILMRKLLDKP